MKSGAGWELNQCEQADVTKLLDFRTIAKRFIFFAHRQGAAARSQVQASTASDKCHLVRASDARGDSIKPALNTRKGTRQ